MPSRFARQDEVSGPVSKLLFTEQDLRSTVTDLSTPDTLLVMDEYNRAALEDIATSVVVEDTDAIEIERVTRGGGYGRVVAVGGCTALDFGRACARGMDLAVVPTILSHCCISSNRSVIRRGDVYVSEVTTAPRVAMISLPTLEKNHADMSKNWSASGFGDLFSIFAAVAEANWYADKPPQDLFRREATIGEEALTWLESEPYPLDRTGLVRLARFLHEFSVVGHNSIPVGSEHALYYALRQKYAYPRMVATHGKLVSIGTLLILRAWSERYTDFSMYYNVRHTFAKVGLPLSLPDLERMGVFPDHICTACRTLAGPNLLDQLLRTDPSLLTRVFPPSQNETAVELPISSGRLWK